MYAITFDLDTDTLEKSYHVATYTNAYTDIKKILVNKYGFEWKQGSVYFGAPSATAVTCMLAIQELTVTYSWFGPSVRDIRMLRIEELNDLRPIIDQTLQIQRGNQPPR